MSAGAKCEANAKGSPKCAASCALKRLEPRSQIGTRGQIPPERSRGPSVSTRRTPKAKIDASGKQRLQRPELLGDHQRRVVRQHDAAGADPNRPSTASDMRNDNRSRGARDAGHIVVLREPESM